MRDRFGLAIFLLCLCAPAFPGVAAADVSADTIYVDKGVSGAGDGSSWTDAYTSLQDALKDARSNGTDDAVWVAAGTYYPDEGSSANGDDRTESFRVESGIDLRGHFSGDEEALEDRTLARGGPKTVLSGEIQQDGTQSNNAYTVLRLTGGSAGELHVEDGAANGTAEQARGGGVYITGGTLHHAVLTGNRAKRGAAALVTGSPTLEVIRATGNHATAVGAVYFRDDASTAGHLTVADNTAGEASNGLRFAESDATLSDVAAGTSTTSAVAERITITFNPKTVGNSLYSGGYSGELDYTVSTGDTTFSTSGSTTADVPISDGDQLEIAQSDSEYISTFMVNNTDTELPPMQVDPFPAEPDYQSTSSVTIDKSNLVNEYQVAGIPDTSPEGYSTIDDWKPHLDDNDVRRWTDLGGLTSLETYILEGSSEQWENKADEVVPEVQPFLPFTVDGPTYVTESKLQDIFDERNDRNIARFEEGPSSFSIFTEGNYLQNTAGKFSEGDNLGTTRSEVYGAFTGMDETDDHFVTVKILNDNGEFISSEAKFPIRIIYSTESPTNIY